MVLFVSYCFDAKRDAAISKQICDRIGERDTLSFSSDGWSSAHHNKLRSLHCKKIKQKSKGESVEGKTYQIAGLPKWESPTHFSPFKWWFVITVSKSNYLFPSVA